MLFNLMISFLKIGCVGFGGGSALIPIVENEIVKNKKYISEHDYIEHIIVSNITPGALPVKLACMAGYVTCGIPGMLACASAVALPGTLITVIALVLLSQLGSTIINQIVLASVGISVFIIYLLLEYIHKVFLDAKTVNFSNFAIFLVLVTFIATCGKNLAHLSDLIFAEMSLLNAFPIPSLSTIDMLGLAFFVIFFTGGKIKSWRIIVALIISILHMFLLAKGITFQNNSVKFWFLLFMFGLATLFFIYDFLKDTSKNLKYPSWKNIFFQLIAWISFIIIFCLPAIFLSKGIPHFLIDGILSTVSSFGGGEAYLTIADNMFVSTEIISSTTFYGKIVPIANALPGPILIKILCGVGFDLGFTENGIAMGLVIAMAGFGISIGATCIICTVVNTVYACFSDMKIFNILKQWILPVICGLLFSVVLSILCEMLKVTNSVGIENSVSIICFIVLFFVIKMLSRRYHINGIFIIIAAGCATLVWLNIVS